MKVLVTGANGYLGQGVVKQLLDDGYEVVATDFSCTYIDARAERIKSDLFNVEKPYEFFGKPDILLHMAWKNGFVHNEKSHMEELPLHFNFIRELIKSKIHKVVVMGSMHEVGFYEGSIKSDTPTNPQSLYGISKNALRQAVELLSGQNHVLFQWIRGFYIVGNSEYGSSIFSKITHAEKCGDELFPFTSGKNQWDFIDYSDFCMQVAAIVEQDEYSGIINACSGYPERLAERVERFIKDRHYNINLDYGKFPDRPYDSKAVWGDNTVIEKILDKREKRNS